jgi:hypothetical protein
MENPNLDYPCIESTVEFQAGPYEVRAWFNEIRISEFEQHSNEAFKEHARAHAHLSMGELAVFLAARPRVNAVHIKTKETGDGVVLYVNWP